MSGKRVHPASVRERRVTRLHPGDEVQEEVIATVSGKRRRTRSRKTVVELPVETQKEQGKSRIGSAPSGERDRSRRRLRSHESERIPQSLHRNKPSVPRQLCWSFVVVIAIAVAAIVFHLKGHNVHIPPDKPDKPDVPKQSPPDVPKQSPPERGLWGPWEIVPATLLGKWQHDCVMQVRVMITHIFTSGIYKSLHPKWKNELLYLEEDLTRFDRSSSYTMSGQHDPVRLLWGMADTNNYCTIIDASFDSYLPDQYHDFTTLLSVYTQDTINQFLLRFWTTNITVSTPFLSSHERATRLKASRWAATTSALSDRTDKILEHLESIARGPFLVIADQTTSLASHLLVASAHQAARAAQPPPQPTPTGIKAFLGFAPPVPVTPPAVKYNFTDALDVVAHTTRYLNHLLRSVDAASARVSDLQRVLEAGPWVDTRVVTDEQWRRREEEMQEWVLEVREGIRGLGEYEWWDQDWEKYHKLDKREKVRYVEEVVEEDVEEDVEGDG